MAQGTPLLFLHGHIPLLGVNRLRWGRRMGRGRSGVACGGSRYQDDTTGLASDTKPTPLDPMVGYSIASFTACTTKEHGFPVFVTPYSGGRTNRS